MPDFLKEVGLADRISILGTIITFIALLVAIIQINQNTNVHKSDSHKEAVVRGVELARFFQEHLVFNISTILQVYELSGLSEIVSKCVTEANYDFTESEMERLFSKDIIQKYMINRKKLTDDAFLSSVNYHLQVENTSDGKVIGLTPTQKFNKIYNDTINTIEWMAMLINTGAADSSVIFQSLHQLILLYIRLSYFELCLSNTSNIHCEKYYTNTILLYANWNSKVIMLTKMQKRESESATRKIDKIREKQERNKGKHITSPKKVL